MKLDNPSHPTWKGLKLAKRTRIAAAIKHLLDTGMLNRAIIVSAGEVSFAQAALDIREIKKRAPDLITYDMRARTYRLKEKDQH